MAASGVDAVQLRWRDELWSVAFLSLVGKQGERAHVRAAPAS